MKKTLVLSTLILLTATATLADHHERMPDPKLRQLDALAGNWKCTGKMFATPMGPEHATAAEVSTKWGLNGYWLPFTYAEKKTADNPMPATFTGFFGYDLETKKFVVGGVDNMGGWSQAASDGWDGDAIVFSGPWHLGGQTVNGRDTFRKNSNGTLTHTGEVEMNGAWVTVSEETCRK